MAAACIAQVHDVVPLQAPAALFSVPEGAWLSTCAHQVLPIVRLQRRIVKAIRRCLAALKVADASALLLSCMQRAFENSAPDESEVGYRTLSPACHCARDRAPARQHLPQWPNFAMVCFPTHACSHPDMVVRIWVLAAGYSWPGFGYHRRLMGKQLQGTASQPFFFSTTS